MQVNTIKVIDIWDTNTKQPWPIRKRVWSKEMAIEWTLAIDEYFVISLPGIFGEGRNLPLR
jgi:hypothetical protein